MEHDTVPTLARTTYDRLRSDVLNGYWPPGQKLLMHSLRERYQVGASPLREALNRLASEDWVVHNDQRGFSVSLASKAKLEDLVRTRITIESLAIAQSIKARGQAWEENLVIAFHRLAKTPRSASVDSYSENPQWEQFHKAFHKALLAGCESNLLLNFCEQLYDMAYWYRRLAVHTSYKHRNELDEHRAIFDAVIDGNEELAKRLIFDHYHRTANIFYGLASI